MNPAACARAKKAARLEREAALAPAVVPEPPKTPQEAMHRAYAAYRKHTRPYRRVFAGIITRKEAERFVKMRVEKQRRVLQGLEEQGE